LQTTRFFHGRRSSFPGQFQRSTLAEKLGCEFCPEDGCIQCSEYTATCAPGVYAAGNCSKGVQLVIVTVADWMRAAFAINNALLEADAASGKLRHPAIDAVR
jgi:thioredoxin reductase